MFERGDASAEDCAMQNGVTYDDRELIARLDAANAWVSRAQRELLRLVREAAECQLWRAEGARDLAHWLSMRYGISSWKAHRWIRAADALEELPAIEKAFAAGSLSLDKAVELTRFASAEDEASLARWAADVSVATVRRRGDRAAHHDAREVLASEQARTLSWWWLEEGSRLGLHAELPAAQGAVVVKALERAAERVPAMPDADAAWSVEQRHADALVALCSAAIATDPDPDRATVVLHARVEQTGTLAESEIEGGPAIARSVAERLLCDARVEVVLEDSAGNPVGVGRASREPSAWMVRELRHRDRGCRFPGCGTNAFTQAHHVTWWSRGGRTDLENLLLVCSFHHRLVHEYGWTIARDLDREVRWITPDGERYRAGPRAPAVA